MGIELKTFCSPVFGVLFAWFFFSPVALSQAVEPYASQTPTMIDLSAGEPVRDVTGKVGVFRDTSARVTVQEVIEPGDRFEFRTWPTSEPHFGFTDDAIWLRLRLDNRSGGSETWRLVLSTNFMKELSVWKTSKAGSSSLVLDQRKGSPFSSRIIPHPYLIAPFDVEAGETSELYIRYRSDGNTSMPIRLETEESFAAWAQGLSAKLYVFYGVMAVLIIASIAGWLATQRFVFGAYTAYALCVLLYLAHLDGTTFQYLWPFAPEWNTFASLPIGCAVGFTAAYFVRAYLNVREDHPTGNKILWFIMAGCIALPLSVPLIGESAAKAYSTLWVTAASLVYLGIGIQAVRREPHLRLWFFLAGWAGIVIASLTLTGRDILNFETGRRDSVDVIRVAMVFDAVMMGLAMAAGITQLKRERDQSLREQYLTAQRNLALHERVNSVESRYAEAAEAAERSGKALADTSHDIRQPLFALRAAMRDLETAQTSSPEQYSTIEKSLSYIEALVNEQLETFVVDRAQETPTGPTHTQTSSVLNAVEDMFSADANAMGVAFKIVPNQFVAAADHLTLLRIVSNFVSNALSHAQASKVLVGCRKKGNTICFEVHDNGKGLTQDDMQTIMQRGVRGDDSEQGGKGLGLSIAADLARKSNLEIYVQSQVGRGSMFGVKAPLAKLNCKGAT